MITHWQELIPYHGIQDKAKFEALAASMRKDGWVGAPLVVHSGYLLTGPHRYAAALMVGREDYGFEVPTVDLTDEFDLSESDVEDLELAMEGYGWQLAATEMATAADKTLADYYGMDIQY
jgi:ParB-like chromosome segregation protein Spo0J